MMGIDRSGFKKQLATMFKPVRVVATVLLFAAIVMTFVSAFVLPTILCIIFVVVSHPPIIQNEYTFLANGFPG